MSFWFWFIILTGLPCELLQGNPQIPLLKTGITLNFSWKDAW
jgi:hypothetical protein